VPDLLGVCSVAPMSFRAPVPAPVPLIQIAARKKLTGPLEPLAAKMIKKIDRIVSGVPEGFRRLEVFQEFVLKEINMKFWPLILTSTIMAAGLSACASGQSAQLSLHEKLQARNLVLAEPVNRVKYMRINGWSELDDRHVILSAGASDRYLLTLRNVCRDLDSSMNIGFSSTVGNLTTADKLIVKGPGGFVDYCYISTITRLAKADKVS
jgi:hypothetical protein